MTQNDVFYVLIILLIIVLYVAWYCYRELLRYALGYKKENK